MLKIDLKAIELLAKEIIERANCRLYDIEFNEVSRILKIFIDREQGGITIKDCEMISNAVSDALDTANLIDFRYTLEVSSPGIGRFLTRPEHFQWALGRLAEINLKNRRVKCYIRYVTDESITIAEDSGEIIIPLKEIIKAKTSEEFDYGKRR